MTPKEASLIQSLIDSPRGRYKMLVASGMFWVYFPWATGRYEEDIEKAKRILEETL